MTRAGLPLVGIVLGLTSCYSIIGPDETLPPDAVPTDPLAEYEQWYAEVEVCTGETGSFGDVRWFEVPYERWWDPVWEQYAIGTWRAPHDIYLAASAIEDEKVVKHEMVHDLLQGGLTYDSRFFNCSGIRHGP